MDFLFQIVICLICINQIAQCGLNFIRVILGECGTELGYKMGGSFVQVVLEANLPCLKKTSFISELQLSLSVFLKLWKW